MKVTLKDAIPMVEKYMKIGLVPFLHSSPGIGKSDAIRYIAAKYNLKLIDLRLSQCDSTDLNGLIKMDGKKASYSPMDTFPLESDPIPENYAGWLLFFDELNSAPRSVQSASYKIVLDRMIGQQHLHKKVAIACAGNLNTDNAIVEDMSTALQSRLCHLEVEVDLDSWLIWAAEHNIDYKITSYLQFKPGNLYSFNPDHSDKTYACPRTWSFANKVLTVADNPKEMLVMLAGTIGEGIAREFVGYTKIDGQLPKMKDILANPKGIKIPDEPSILYALSGAVSHHSTNDNLTDLMLFVSRFPMEFQVVTLKDIIRRDKTKLQHASVQKWISENSAELF